MKVNIARLTQLLKQNYGFDAVKFTRLSGWYDANFRITTRGKKDYFLKIYGVDKFSAVTFQIDFIETCFKGGIPVAEVLKARNGRKYFNYAGKPAILQRYLQGKHLSEVSLNPHLLQSVGKVLGSVSKVVKGKSFKGQAWKEYLWDPAQFDLVIDRYPRAKKYIGSKNRRLIEQVFNEWKVRKIQLKKLPKGVIHNDFHGENILVERDRCTGVTDFGDANFSWLVGDVAVALEHICFQKKYKILEHSQALLEGYTKVRKLNELERDLLPFLIRTRAGGLAVETPLYFKGRPPGIYRHFLKWAHSTLEYFSDPKNEKRFREMLKVV